MKFKKNELLFSYHFGQPIFILKKKVELYVHYNICMHLIPSHTKVLLRTSFRCLCLNVQNNAHFFFCLFLMPCTYTWNAFLLPLSSLSFHLYNPLLFHTLMSFLRMTNKICIYNVTV